MTIRKLNQGTPTLAAQVPFYDTDNGVDRRCSVNELQALILGDLVDEGDVRITQYATRDASGFSVTITPVVAGQDVWLLLTLTGAFAAGTVVLPLVTECQDQQEVEVLCSHDLAALTVTGNGATVVGAPAALTANTPFKLRFDAVNQAWKRAV